LCVGEVPDDAGGLAEEPQREVLAVQVLGEDRGVEGHVFREEGRDLRGVVAFRGAGERMCQHDGSPVPVIAVVTDARAGLRFSRRPSFRERQAAARHLIRPYRVGASEEVTELPGEWWPKVDGYRGSCRSFAVRVSR